MEKTKIVNGICQETNKVVGLFDELKIENNGVALTNDEKDAILDMIDSPKDENGYYIDDDNKKVSFNGILGLRKEHTKITMNDYQKREFEACANSFSYFRENYCKILTNKGVSRPNFRKYQGRVENILTNTSSDVIISLPRQSGKCVVNVTLITVRDDDTGEVKKMTISDFHELVS